MECKKVNFDYDEEYDSLFIFCEEDYEYESSIGFGADVILDFSTEGVPVAFELLNASRLFDVERGDFFNINSLNIKSKITEKEIKVQLKVLILSIDQPINVGFDRVISNITHIPENDCELAFV